MIKEKIYFLIPDTHNLNDDSIVYLAEGLSDLGINFSANRNYWKIAEDRFLFNATSSPPADFDIVVVSYKWTEHMDPFTFKIVSNPLPVWLFDKNRKYITVYLDPRDGYETLSYTPAYRNFDFIFRAKKNRRTKNFSNIYPWVLGYQKRVLNEVKGIRPDDKRYTIAVNFNYSHPYKHQLRTLAEQRIISKIPVSLIDRTLSPKTKPTNNYSLMMWENTVGLHNPKYYNHIESCLMVATFCGDLIPGLPDNPSIYLKGGNQAKVKKNIYAGLAKLLNKYQRIIQWDSWRFWETLAVSSVPIHIDLEKYGVELPVMPSNWAQYIGIDLDNIGPSIERIIEDREHIYKMAIEGNKWALENYSPKASALRFLQILKLHV